MLMFQGGKLCEDESTRGSQEMCYLWCLFTTGVGGILLRAGIPSFVPDFCLYWSPVTSPRIRRLRTNTVTTS